MEVLVAEMVFHRFSCESKNIYEQDESPELLLINPSDQLDQSSESRSSTAPGFRFGSLRFSQRRIGDFTSFRSEREVSA